MNFNAFQNQLNEIGAGHGLALGDQRRSGNYFFTIHRDNLLEDSFKQLGHLKGSDLKSKIRIQYIDEHGMREAGIDGGGIFKDYVEELVKHSFNPEYGFFIISEDQALYPNPSAPEVLPHALEYIQFLGKVLGITT